MKKAAVIVIGAVIVILVGWRLFDSFSSGGQPGMMGRGNGNAAVPVEVKAVERQSIRQIGEFTGSLLPKSSFNVAPKVSGRLEKVLVNIGDTVKNGELVALLDNEEYTQAVVQARADVDVSKANLADAKSAQDVAMRDYDRAQELKKQKIASATELDAALAKYNAAQAKYQVAEATVKQKEAAQKTAEVRLSYTRINVTWDEGTGSRRVAERFVDDGAMLSANAPIVSIVDLTSVRAIINIVEKDFPEIRLDQPATVVTDAYPDKTFTGYVARRAPVLQEQSRQSRVEIEIPNSEGLLAPGMYVRVQIQYSQHDNAIVVPRNALVNRDQTQGVFLVDAEQKVAKFVAVKTGIMNDSVAEILSPEIQGMVVVLGQHLLTDGASVLLSQEETAAEAPGGKPAASDKKGTQERNR